MKITQPNICMTMIVLVLLMMTLSPSHSEALCHENHRNYIRFLLNLKSSGSSVEEALFPDDNADWFRDSSIILQLFIPADLIKSRFILNQCLADTPAWNPQQAIIDQENLDQASQMALNDCKDVRRSIIRCITVDLRSEIIRLYPRR
ncbi:hypothetical protein RF11_02092 [Thelohanellus kitauei]|uniref:Uncharacterized protein n=1 Tax=Thelohanellus kitauei TaxID=669202 RepID=A0A0C2MXT8_THEKT|nr:hypothetical protein RF11_02092 [Thelohanellus kitauei]